MIDLKSFSEPIQAVVIGASGAIGSAFVDYLVHQDKVEKVYAFSRSQKIFDHPKAISNFIDLTIEDSIKKASETIQGSAHIIIIASGILHDDDVRREKSLRDLNQDVFMKVFQVNCFGPALVAKYFIPLLPKDKKGIFAALSARVGSISDNQIGGWYGYRASKSALNMIIKTASIEVARRYKQAVIMGLHPNTVDTKLSRPFHGGIDHEIFTAEKSVLHMMKVIDTVTAEDTGNLFAWDGEKIPA